MTTDSVVSTVDVGSSLRVTHDYHPSPATPNLYEITVSITNISTQSVDLRYRRVMDWDVEPTPFREFVTVAVPPPLAVPPSVLFTSDDGFASPDPLAGPSDISATGLFVDAGQFDNGALFDLGLGVIDSLETATFTLFYGAAVTEQEALQAINTVGAQIYSLGQPSTPDGPNLGIPNTFIFAYKEGTVSAAAATLEGVASSPVSDGPMSPPGPRPSNG